MERDRMLLELLANVVVALHLAYLAFLIVGGFFAWRWTWVTWPHLVASGWAFAIVVVGFSCPLTVWEKSLRRAGGGNAYSGTFTGHYIDGTVYPQGQTRHAEYVLLGIVLVAYAVLGAKRLSHARTGP